MAITAFKQVADNAITTTSTVMTSTGVTSSILASNTNFPTPGNGFIATLWNGTDPNQDANMEKVTVTANSAGTLTHSPTTKTHTAPTFVAILNVSSNISDLQTAINANESTLTLTAGKQSVTVASLVVSVAATARITTITNNAASAVTITMATSGATDGQLALVRFYDFSVAAQTLSWVNTENSTATVPTTSNGSTSLPLTIGFQYNALTTKWRCLAVA